MTKMKLDLLAGFVAIALFSIAGVPASAEEDANKKAAELVDQATITFKHFVADPDQHMFRQYLKEAKGIFILPSLIKGGFLLGASGGNGILLGRDEETGEWSFPSFYTMGSFNIGFQVGVEQAEVIMLLRNAHDVASLLATTHKIGTDITVAAGQGGGGVAAKTANILVYTRAKGAFIGLTLENAVMKPRIDWNQAYYGKPARPEDILIRRNVSNMQATPLRMALRKTMNELRAHKAGEISIAAPATTP